MLPTPYFNDRFSDVCLCHQSNSLAILPEIIQVGGTMHDSADIKHMYQCLIEYIMHLGGVIDKGYDPRGGGVSFLFVDCFTRPVLSLIKPCLYSSAVENQQS